MAQACKDCDSPVIIGNRGNGKCSHCHGRGTKNTIVNDISGANTKCWKCRGTGTCASCGGSGSIASAQAAKQVSSVRQQPPTPVPSTDLERSWYQLCNSSAFIPESEVDQYYAQLTAARKHAAIAVGLSDFTDSACPKCGRRGQFKIRFLGRLRHPECRTSWYAGPGTYIVFQVGQIFHSGIRAGGSVKEDADRKGDRAGGIFGAIFGFLFVAIFRAALAVILIPIQAIVSLTQSKPKRQADGSPHAATQASGRTARGT